MNPTRNVVNNLEGLQELQHLFEYKLTTLIKIQLPGNNVIS